MLAGCVCNHHCLGEEYLKHYRLFPPRFSDKGRFIPAAQILCWSLPSLQKHKNNSGAAFGDPRSIQLQHVEQMKLEHVEQMQNVSDKAME